MGGGGVNTMAFNIKNIHQLVAKQCDSNKLMDIILASPAGFLLCCLHF